MPGTPRGEADADRLGADPQKDRSVAESEARIDGRLELGDEIRQRGHQRPRGDLEILKHHLPGGIPAPGIGEREPGPGHVDTDHSLRPHRAADDREHPVHPPVGERPGENHPLDEPSLRDDELAGGREELHPRRAAQPAATEADVERPEG